VTATRVVRRGAFPQLAYSWDGLLPLDLVRRRPAGRFTTIEFEQPFEANMDTYRSLVGRMVSLVGLRDTFPTGATGQSTGSPKKSLGF
jgi:hypothetical protein